MRNSKKGFALVEMIVAFAVIGAVSAVTAGYFHAAKVRQIKQFVNRPNTTVRARTVTVQLAPQGDSTRHGIAVLAEVQGKVKVVVNLSGLNDGVANPAHIHMGACPNVGAVKYPLTSLTNGASQTDLDMSLDELLTQLPLAINIHKSSDEPKIYLACGDIQYQPWHDE